MSVSPPSPLVVSPEVVIPKQCRLLGATVRNVGLVTTVSRANVWRWCLIERPDGSEAHAFLGDLCKNQLVMPDGQQPYRELTRNIGHGVIEDCYVFELPNLNPNALPSLETVPCPDCGGDGHFEDLYDVKPFSCANCGGSVEIERCSGCELQPGVVAGTEVCGCPKAA